MKKIIGILICLMLVLTGSTAFAATNWIKNVDVPTWHESNWTEFATADWTVFNDSGIDMYLWNDTTETYGISICDTSSTDRGYCLFITTFNQSTEGLVFGYVGNQANQSWLVVPSYSDDTVHIMHHTGSGSLSPASEVINNFSSEYPIDQDEFYVVRAIYSRYTGQLQYKIWPTGEDEPVNWTIDITDSDLERSQATKWGLFAVQDVPTCYAAFAYFYVQELPYNTVSGVPTIIAPDVDYDSIVADFDFSSPPAQAIFDARETLDLSVVERYPDNTSCPSDNSYYFSGWDSTQMKLGLYIESCTDLTNNSDAGMMAFDINHNHVIDVGDRIVEWITYGNTSDLACATYNGTDWETDVTNFTEPTALFTPSLQMTNPHRVWNIKIDLISLLGSENNVWNFVEHKSYIGFMIILSDHSSDPDFIWNNWNRETNTSITNYSNAIWNPLYYGHLGLSGVRPVVEEVPDYVDLNDFTAGALENKIVSYDSLVWNVPRYAIKTSDMLDGSITKIKVPTLLTKSAFFGLFTSTVSTSSVLFYGITLQTFQITDITSQARKGHDGNYTLGEKVLKQYDVIVIIPNPSTLDTSKTLFKLLYKGNVIV